MSLWRCLRLRKHWKALLSRTDTCRSWLNTNGLLSSFPQPGRRWRQSWMERVNVKWCSLLSLSSLSMRG